MVYKRGSGHIKARRLGLNVLFDHSSGPLQAANCAGLQLKCLVSVPAENSCSSNGNISLDAIIKAPK